MFRHTLAELSEATRLISEQAEQQALQGDVYIQVDPVPAQPSYQSRLYTQSPFYKKVQDVIAILEKEFANVDAQLSHRNKLKGGYWASFAFTVMSLLALPMLTKMLVDTVFVARSYARHEPFASQGDELAKQILQNYVATPGRYDCPSVKILKELDPHERQQLHCLKFLMGDREYEKNQALHDLLDMFAPMFNEWLQFAEELDEVYLWGFGGALMVAVAALMSVGVMCLYMFRDCKEHSIVDKQANRQLAAKMNINAADAIMEEEKPTDNQKIIHLMDILGLEPEDLDKRALLELLKKFSLAHERSFSFFAANAKMDEGLPNDLQRIIHSHLMREFSDDLERQNAGRLNYISPL